MKRLLIIISTLLIFLACKNNKTESQLTKLDKYVLETDSLQYTAENFDKIGELLNNYKQNLEILKTENFDRDSAGLLRKKELRYYDITTVDRRDLNYILSIKEFKTNRQAAEDFKTIIEFHACCIPDSDIEKLKNFENLERFKNTSSVTVLAENLIIEVGFSRQDIDQKKILELLTEILRDNKYLKLEIGHGGPAIWTINNNAP